MAHKPPLKLASVAALAVAVCSYALAGSTEIDGGLVLLQLTPAGEFLPSDGRALESPPWRIDAASAQAVIDRFHALSQPPVIDYEHQTLNKEKNGQPAPAAGWMRDLRWIDGKGLYAVTDLTARAKGFIDAKEYLYISPVFEYAKDTGTVLAIHMAALTNTPALHGMDPLTLRAAASAAFLIPTTQEPTLNPLLKAVLAALGLPDTTTESAACTALADIGPLSKLKDKAAAACTALGLQADASVESVIAACTSLRTATSVDPAKYVPVAVVDELRTNMAALTSRQAQADIDAAVAPALADGRLLPGAQETWARDLGKTNLAALTSYLATARPIAALT
ncbi:MAG: phage protease, partial [Rhodoferax sp.]|nr:phage protease [Rhodoferax sp.]